MPAAFCDQKAFCSAFSRKSGKTSVKISIHRPGFVKHLLHLGAEQGVVRGGQLRVLCQDVCGFGLGATPNAIANMTAMTEIFGPAPTAFFVIPLIGSLIIDPVNATIITIFINLLH